MSTPGQVLVTGGTGALGASTTKWLTRAGHDVIVFARHEPPTLPKGAWFVAGDIGSFDSVRRAIADCDTVVHLAWSLSGTVTHEQAEPINIGGTRNVLNAMSESDCRRMVFASSVTAYGAHSDHPQPWREHEKLDPAYGLVYEWHKAQAERMIAESGVEAIRVRPTVVVGSEARNAPANVFRQLAIPSFGAKSKIQLIHEDDVGRFFAHACDSAAVGPVNLAAEDTLTWRDLAGLAQRPAVPAPPRLLGPITHAAARVIPVARSVPDLVDMFVHWPVADTTRLKNEFGFELAYSSAEAIAEQGRGSTSYVVLGMKELRRPSRLGRANPGPAAQGDPSGAAVQVIPDACAGEFDTRCSDPRYPEWTCANLEEAFPGPMTPLSLHLVRDALFAGADQVADLLPVNSTVKDNVRTRQLGIFGHRFFQNASVLREMITAVPGYTPEDFEHQINGRPYPPDFSRPRPGLSELVNYAKFAARALPRLAGLRRTVAGIERRAEEVTLRSAELHALSDAELRARITSLWTDAVEGWDAGLLCTFVVAAPNSMIERRYGADAVTRSLNNANSLASSRLLHGVKELAARAKTRPAAEHILTAGIREGSWDELRQADPEFSRGVSALLDLAGHRGPGETELANRVYADSPELLLRAIAGVTDGSSPVRPVTAPPQDMVYRVLGPLAWALVAQRERCRDAVMRTTHQLRLALREWGTRLATRGEILEPEDVFYLTPDELFCSAPDTTGTIARRRAEREALAKMDVPLRFSGTIDTVTRRAHGVPPSVLTGVGAVAGVATGRVRILSTPDDELEPGDVLVARVTDTGWTPFFATAAAVVTDIGGLMSHASIVAREFGIPAVVGTDCASQVLVNGQLVEVDGAKGTVTVIERGDDHR